MIDNSKQALYSLLLDLVSIPSVSPSAEMENRIARFIHSRLRELPYFDERPGDLRLLPLEGDPHGRYLVFAMVRAESETADTVILTGHMDVVGVEVCGSLAPYAFRPEEYSRRLVSAVISPDARKDLETGQWLFGRGVADMKSGVAAGMDLFMEAASGPGKYGANVAVLFVPTRRTTPWGCSRPPPTWPVFRRKKGSTTWPVSTWSPPSPRGRRPARRFTWEVWER